MDVRLDDEALKAIFAKTIMDTLTPERREQILTAAESLISEKSEVGGAYGNKKSKLQEAFDYSVRQMANEIVTRELSENAEVKAKLREMFLAAWEEADRRRCRRQDR